MDRQEIDMYTYIYMCVYSQAPKKSFSTLEKFCAIYIPPNYK